MDRRDFVAIVGQAAVGTALAPWWASAQQTPDAIPRRYLYCYTHRLDMERGFKFHCLVLDRDRGVYGRHEYAGFFTVRVGEHPWMFLGEPSPDHVLVPHTLADLKQGRFGILRSTPAWSIQQFVQWNAMYPATWLSAGVKCEGGLRVTGALLGWGWAQKHTGTVWFASGARLRRTPGGLLELPADSQWFGYHDASESFTGILAFPRPCARAWVDDDGVYWDWGLAAEADLTPLHDATYILVPELLTADEMTRLVHMLNAPPRGLACTIAANPAASWKAAVSGIEAVPVPPSLTGLLTDQLGGVELEAAAGRVLVIPSATVSISLPEVPEIESPLPQVAAPALVVDVVCSHITDVLAHRQPDGRFAFSLGRTFYDGITCACLAQALPILPDELRRQTRDAIRECLDALREGHQRSPAYGLIVPPEVPSFIQTAIDYPEITATLLYALLAYALNAEPGYAAEWAPLIETHRRQIREMTTPEGLAWARADTQHLHLIAESAIGGYIAWCSLYHLGKLLFRPWASDCRALAALNWAAYRQLFRWRKEAYGDAGVVSGWSNWCAELDQSVPWSYVQTTWFSFVPFMAYNARDEFHIWKNLRDQPWWDYTRTEESSRQRCYDYANMLAFAKAGLWEQDVGAHYQAVTSRPFWFDTFDATPVMAIAALPQLAAMGLLP